jgi:phosphinothricin acetyltransferase
MHVRDATAQDLPAIVEIYNSTIPTRASTVEVRPAWFGEHEPSRRPIRVMEDEGEIVGWLSLSEFYDGRPAYHATADVGVYVDRGHRRKGVGRRLVEEAVSRAPELGLRTPTAGAFAHNGASIDPLRGPWFRGVGPLPEGRRVRRRGEGLGRDGPQAGRVGARGATSVSGAAAREHTPREKGGRCPPPQTRNVARAVGFPTRRPRTERIRSSA